MKNYEGENVSMEPASADQVYPFTRGKPLCEWVETMRREMLNHYQAFQLIPNFYDAEQIRLYVVGADNSGVTLQFPGAVLKKYSVDRVNREYNKPLNWGFEQQSPELWAQAAHDFREKFKGIGK